MSVKKLSEDLKFEGRIFNVVEEKVNVNGHLEVRQRVDKSNSVTVLVVDANNENVLVTQEYRCGDGVESWGFPAGLVNDGETAEQAVHRELIEEVGINIDVNGLSAIGTFSLSSGFTTENSTVFIARLTDTNHVKVPTFWDEDEFISQVKWVSLDEAFELVTSITAQLALRQYKLETK